MNVLDYLTMKYPTTLVSARFDTVIPTFSSIFVIYTNIVNDICNLYKYRFVSCACSVSEDDIHVSIFCVYSDKL